VRFGKKAHAINIAASLLTCGLWAPAYLAAWVTRRSGKNPLFAYLAAGGVLILFLFAAGANSPDPVTTPAPVSTTSPITSAVPPAPPMTVAPSTVPTTTAPPTTTKAPVRPTTKKKTTTTKKTTPKKTTPRSVYYANCAAAEAAGAAPLYRGDPGYRSGLDRDGDGVACEQ